jgi:photosystem II stability/assembly factor-like uncharacterized protein
MVMLFPVRGRANGLARNCAAFLAGACAIWAGACATLVRAGAAASLLHPAASGASAWAPIGPWGGPGGAVSIDHQNPSRILAASRNGNLFLSADGGQHWRRLAFPRIETGFIETVKIHPGASGTLLAGASDERGEAGGLYFSLNGGETWKLAAATRGESVFALASFPGDPNLWAAGTRRGVLLSRDGGVTWKPAAPGPFPVMSIAFDSKDPNTFYAGTTHLPWKTTDGGRSWRSIHEGMLDDSDVFSIHVDSQQPERVYASACSGIYRSTQRGEPWKKAQGIPGTDRRTHVVVEDPHFSRLIYAGTTAGLWKSADAGETWRKLNGSNIRSLEFHPRDGRIAYMATDRGLMKSTTAALSFEEINQGFSGKPVLRAAAAGSEIWAMTLETTGHAVLQRSANQGRTWQMEAVPPQLQDLAEIAERLYARAGGRWYRRENSQWKPLALPGGPAGLLTGTAGFLWAAAGNALYRSADGVTWKNEGILEPPDRIAGFAQAVAAERGGRLSLRSADGRWIQCGAPPGRLFTFLPDPQRSGALLAGTESGLWRWQTGTWTHLEGGLLPGYISAIAVHPDRRQQWYAAQAGRLFFSPDAGESWKLAGGEAHQGGELPPGSELDGSIERLEASSTGLIAVVRGRGAYLRQHLQ